MYLSKRHVSLNTDVKLWRLVNPTLYFSSNILIYSAVNSNIHLVILFISFVQLLRMDKTGAFNFKIL